MQNQTKTMSLMPREKLLRFGASTLTDEELLAIFLRTGIKGCSVMQLSREVLQHFRSLRGLISATQDQFCQVKGLGITQFIQLQACTEMSKRYLQEALKLPQAFKSPENVRFYLQAALENKEREIFLVLFLDNQHRLIKQEEMFLGTINSTTIHPREIIKSALFCNAAALILAHNHPSGNPTPSLSDKMITTKIQAAAELVEIRILDHFVIGKGCYYSFAENRLL
ncbi:DNA repair protein RadC [Pasteurella multocida]|uniref:RadC family protein n=1 Tax=Pasteurella multocida TaxID=747 RepID=UPI000E07C749|nr:DNA repair protein RadC [Pasteurella multocida]SUB41382.1 RuvA domain 2-like protein [Pasteurella multocida subsp. septica]HDR0626892.1 DNA repair protein RadC [Pasteurella multocida]HDR1433753.1 DNA repair protein RadC [Pasteurella multocida]HDR1791405.1 DNA repair protein RadC [Pasteurella multocida]HDR1792015.1 DNA repair protein RadC [Pasteurella multocida]